MSGSTWTQQQIFWFCLTVYGLLSAVLGDWGTFIAYWTGN